jgi:hypothetical protein
MTPMFALALLSGLLFARKRPVVAGLCLALLVLKPQYAVVPALYLLWTRNGRALAAMTVGALVLETAGFVAVGLSEVGLYVSSFVNAGGEMRDAMFDVQRACQYTWQGFLISADIDANTVVVFDLIVLSAAIVALAWHRGDRGSGAAAAAFGGLLLAPYAYFYDWGMLAVGAVLLLGANVRWKRALPLVVFGMYLALVAAQRATPYPLPPELFGADLGEAPLPPTNGVYWITPLTLAVVAFLALAGRVDETASSEAKSLRFGGLRATWPREAIAGALVLVPAAYFATAFVGHMPPFTQAGMNSSEAVQRVPVDFPLPDDHHVEDAGTGEELAYRVEWSSDEPVSEVAGIYRRLLDDGNWELMLDESAGAEYNVRIARFTPYGEMTHWALLDVSDEPDGSRIALEFSSIQALAEAAR